MIEIHIKSIPKSQHRYETCGDYFYDADGVLQIRVTEMGNSFYETAVAIHEMFEEVLTKFRGLSEQEIMDFDLYYEKRRELGLVPENSEPGFSNEAPYMKEHIAAQAVEMQMFAMAGLSWADYEQKIDSL